MGTKFKSALRNVIQSTKDVILRRTHTLRAQEFQMSAAVAVAVAVEKDQHSMDCMEVCADPSDKAMNRVLSSNTNSTLYTSLDEVCKDSNKAINKALSSTTNTLCASMDDEEQAKHKENFLNVNDVTIKKNGSSAKKNGSPAKINSRQVENTDSQTKIIASPEKSNDSSVKNNGSKTQDNHNENTEKENGSVVIKKDTVIMKADHNKEPIVVKVDYTNHVV